MQLMSNLLGGTVQKGTKKEYGEIEVCLNTESKLFTGFSDKNICLMSHTDLVTNLPDGFSIIAKTDNCPIAAIENEEKHFYGIQFHAEVNNTVNGTKIIKNFLYNICNCSGSWKMSSFAEESIKSLREKIGDKKVLLALSRWC